MQIELISDIHIDFWINPKENTQKQTTLIKEFVKNILKPTSNETLVIAGDLGHYNNQNLLLLKELQNYYRYIIITWGNHDLYLVSKRQEKLYKTSFARLESFKKALLEYENIFFLDGDYLELEGVKFWGSGLWYEVPKHLMQDWFTISNDGVFIKEDKIFYSDFDSFGRQKIYKFNPNKLYQKELEKLEKVKDIDIIITHIPPLFIGDKNKVEDYFYYSNAKAFIEKLQAKYWLFGHYHKGYNNRYKTTQLLASPLGYKNEKYFHKMYVFSI